MAGSVGQKKTSQPYRDHYFTLFHIISGFSELWYSQYLLETQGRYLFSVGLNCTWHYFNYLEKTKCLDMG